jgi:Fe-S cluster assembly ATP-binding protein
MKHSLQIKNLSVSREGRDIVRDLNLEIKVGEVVALMGPNGSGKSTLAGALAGHPACVVTHGKILIDGTDITFATPDKRARSGLFLSLQHPPEIPGLTLAEFLRTAYNQVHEEDLQPREFRQLLLERVETLKMDPALLSRGLNEGFSGGERKKSEILQLMILAPKYVILDETDSGLDVDALKAVSEGIDVARSAAESGLGILVITHHVNILDYLKPDRVVVMIDGRIFREGGPELADKIERQGFEKI